MAMYRCYECESFVDDDYHPCEEHPRVETELACPSCMESMAERAEEERNGEDFRKPRIAFSKAQRLEIARMEAEGPHEY